MEIDLAGRRDGVAERYVPELMRGELLEAEHVARYRWIAPLAPGRRVLDAGCGMGYGAAILSAAGAREVVGVDIAQAVLEAARPGMPDGVVLEVADLRSLDADDSSFDLVVCMETIEHFADSDVVLDELARVLTADGLLALSSPNRTVSAGLNPHHHHEYTAAELRSALGDRLGHVRLVGQRSFTGSAVDPLDEPGDPRLINYPPGDEEGNPQYLLAVASNASLPALSGVFALATEMREDQWATSWAAQQKALDYETERANVAESRLADRAQLQRRLLEAEQLLAESPEREQKLADAVAERDYAIQWARERVEALEQALNVSPARQVVRALRRRVRGS